MSLLLVIFILEMEGKGDSDKSSSFVSNSNLSHVIWILRLVGNFMKIESWVLGTHQQNRFSCSLWFLPYVSGMMINKEEIIFGCTGSLLLLEDFLQYSLFTFRKMLFLDHFIKVRLKKKKLYICYVCHKHFHHLQKFGLPW